MFAYDDFRTWCLASYRKAPKTVYYVVGRVRAMERVGLDLDTFYSSPSEARRQGDRVLVVAKTQGVRRPGGSAHTARSWGKALNWLIDYAPVLRPGVVFERWQLEDEPKADGKTLSQDEVAAMLAYTSADPYLQAFRRALAAVALATKLRRSEVARLRVRDLRRDRGEVWVEFPAKRGPKRAVQAGAELFADRGPLAVYLALRVGAGDALWTLPEGHRGRRPVAGRLAGRQGRAVGVDALGMHFMRMGQELGFQVSFVRTRRHGASRLDALGVHPRVIQHELGHSNLQWTQRYLGGVTRERVLAEFERCRVPGFPPSEASGEAAQ